MKSKKIVAFMLSMAMLVGSVPAFVFADENDVEGIDGSDEIEMVDEDADDEVMDEDPAVSEEQADEEDPDAEVEEIVSVPVYNGAAGDQGNPSGSCGDNATWELIDTDDDGAVDKLVISGTGDTVNIDGIYTPWFDYKSNIVSVEIADGITSIDNYLLCSLSISSITIPASVTRIGEAAFRSCSSLSSVSFSGQSSLATIERNAFEECSSLTGFSLPNSVTSICNDAFMECSNLSTFSISRESQLTSIGENAFYDCSELTSFVIPTKVTTIGTNAFSGCENVTDVYCIADPVNLRWPDTDEPVYPGVTYYTSDFNGSFVDYYPICHVYSDSLSDFETNVNHANVEYYGDLVDEDFSAGDTILVGETLDFGTLGCYVESSPVPDLGPELVQGAWIIDYVDEDSCKLVSLDDPTKVLSIYIGYEPYRDPAPAIKVSSGTGTSEDPFVFERAYSYTVQISGGENAIPSSEYQLSQSVEIGSAMETVTYVADSGYHFETFDDIVSNGVTATRTNETTVTISGTPTGDVQIEIPDAVLSIFSVSLYGADNTTVDGNPNQEDLVGPMQTVTYTANEGYYFDAFPDKTEGGIVIHRVDENTLTVSGTPTRIVFIKVPNAINDEWIGVTNETELKDALQHTTKVRLDSSFATTSSAGLFSYYTMELDLNGNELTIYNDGNEQFCFTGPSTIIADYSNSGTGKIIGGLRPFRETTLTITGGTFDDPFGQNTFNWDNVSISGGRFSFALNSAWIAENCHVEGPEEGYYSVVSDLTYTLVPAKTPTYSEEGNIEHYLGSDQNYYILKGNTYVKTTLAAVTLPELTMIPLFRMTIENSRMNMNIYIPVEGDYQLSDYSVYYDNVEQPLTSKTIDNKEYGFFTITCAAKDMVDTHRIDVRTEDDGSIHYFPAFSVRLYLRALIDNEAYGEKVQNVAKAMLRYGAAAQMALGYKTDTLANDGVDGTDFESLYDLEIEMQTPPEYIVAAFSNLEFSTYYGMNITYTYDISLLIAFRINSDVDEIEARVEIASRVQGVNPDEDIVKDTTGKYLIVKIQNIPILDLAKELCETPDGAIIASDYLARVVNDDSKSDELKILCKAIYAYYQAVDAIQ